jgi:hypothetical protein
MKLLLFTCLILFVGCGVDVEVPDNRTVDEHTTAESCLCATARENVALVLQAYRDKDLEAMAGLIRHGKAIQIADGTKVHVQTRGSGVAGVTVESGANVGEHCWIWDKLLR